ncbi:MAG: ATP synthase F1 subunit gamma [Bacillota bacterium]|jgi:F-type H+-transporting ATPase subunit gamma
MATMQDIRRRIKSINNLQQVTGAMQAVAAAKLRRAQAQLLAARPYTDKTEEVLQRLGGRIDTSLHPLLAQREVSRTGVIVITSDGGLAGSFNANIIRKAADMLAAYDRDATGVIAVGRKGRDYFRRRDYPLMGDFVGLGDDVSFSMADLIANTIVQFYQTGLLDEVYLIYAQYVNTLTQRPVVSRLLPLQPPESSTADVAGSEYIFEPSPEAVLDNLLPRYVATLVYRALLEAKTSEHGARMTAMDSASRNAEEMIKDLTLSLNRARQAAITREISEVVAGADALK